MGDWLCFTSVDHLEGLILTVKFLQKPRICVETPLFLQETKPRGFNRLNSERIVVIWHSPAASQSASRLCDGLRVNAFLQPHASHAPTSHQEMVMWRDLWYVSTTHKWCRWFFGKHREGFENLTVQIQSYHFLGCRRGKPDILCGGECCVDPSNSQNEYLGFIVVLIFNPAKTCQLTGIDYRHSDIVTTLTTGGPSVLNSSIVKPTLHVPVIWCHIPMFALHCRYGLEASVPNISHFGRLNPHFYIALNIIHYENIELLYGCTIILCGWNKRF